MGPQFSTQLRAGVLVALLAQELQFHRTLSKLGALEELIESRQTGVEPDVKVKAADLSKPRRSLPQLSYLDSRPAHSSSVFLKVPITDGIGVVLAKPSRSL